MVFQNRVKEQNKMMSKTAQRRMCLHMTRARDSRVGMIAWEAADAAAESAAIAREAADAAYKDSARADFTAYALADALQLAKDDFREAKLNMKAAYEIADEQSRIARVAADDYERLARVAAETAVEYERMETKR
jgi:hypothetical protein